MEVDGATGEIHVVELASEDGPALWKRSQSLNLVRRQLVTGAPQQPNATPTPSVAAPASQPNGSIRRAGEPDRGLIRSSIRTGLLDRWQSGVPDRDACPLLAKRVHCRRRTGPGSARAGPDLRWMPSVDSSRPSIRRRPSRRGGVRESDQAGQCRRR